MDFALKLFPQMTVEVRYSYIISLIYIENETNLEKVIENSTQTKTDKGTGKSG